MFVNDAQSFYEPYSDSGLFGVKVAGSASHVHIFFISGQRYCECDCLNLEQAQKYFWWRSLTSKNNL